MSIADLKTAYELAVKCVNSSVMIERAAEAEDTQLLAKFREEAGELLIKADAAISNVNEQLARSSAMTQTNPYRGFAGKGTSVHASVVKNLQWMAAYSRNGTAAESPSCDQARMLSDLKAEFDQANGEVTKPTTFQSEILAAMRQGASTPTAIANEVNKARGAKAIQTTSKSVGRYLNTLIARGQVAKSEDGVYSLRDLG